MVYVVAVFYGQRMSTVDLPAPTLSPAEWSLSPSRAMDFKNCALLYRFRVIDKLPEPPSIDAARGTEFDRLFLTDMIQHHKGAVSMVHDLFESYGAAQDEAVFKFASDVNVDQSTEIARMQKMLFALEIEGGAR